MKLKLKELINEKEKENNSYEEKIKMLRKEIENVKETYEEKIKVLIEDKKKK